MLVPKPVPISQGRISKHSKFMCARVGAVKADTNVWSETAPKSHEEAQKLLRMRVGEDIEPSTASEDELLRQNHRTDIVCLWPDALLKAGADIRLRDGGPSSIPESPASPSRRRAQ